MYTLYAIKITQLKISDIFKKYMYIIQSKLYSVKPDDSAPLSLLYT